MEAAKISKENLSKLAQRRRLALAVMVIAIAAVLAYVNTLENEFVFDDVKMIRDNESIRSLSNVPSIFANMFVYEPVEAEGTRIDPSYRPVRFLSYAIDYQFTGESVAGYHISNILYHIVASVLVFLVLVRLTGHYGAALGAALLFVLHPVHTESVAYLTGRKDVLCAIFYLLAFLAFLKYREEPRRRYAILLPVFFAIAFLAKEMAITLPAVMLLYDFGCYLKERKGRAADFARELLSPPNPAIYLPVVVLALFFVVVTLFVKPPVAVGKEELSYWGGSLYVSSITMLRGVSHYIRLLFLPAGLSADYSYNAFPVSHSLFSPFTTLLAFWFLAGLVALGIRLLLGGRFLAGFAILFFFVSLAPVLQIVPQPERIAERFLYLPSIGLVLLGALGLKWLVRRSPAARFAGVGVLALLLVTFLTLTVRRNSDWQNPLTLHRGAIELYPDCARSQLAVAQAYATRANRASDAAGGVVAAAARQDYRDAIRHYNRVLEILPPGTWQGSHRGYALNALAGRGLAHAKAGEFDRAIRDLEKVLGETDVFGVKIAEDPRHIRLHFDLGEAYRAAQEFSKAIEKFDTTLQMAKDVLQAPPQGQREEFRDLMAQTHFRKALTLEGMGMAQEGLAVLREGMEFAGGTAHEISQQHHIGLFQLNLGRNEEAIKSFERVLEICKLHERSPAKFPQSEIHKAKRLTHYMLAEALNRSGRLADAIKTLEKALEIAPDYIEARRDLGYFYLKAGRLDAAEREFRRVLRDRPGDARSRQYLVAIDAKRKALTRGKKPTPQKALLLHRAALRDYEAGELSTAQTKLIEALKIITRLDKNDEVKVLASRVRLLLGRIRFDTGSHYNAKTHLQAGLDALIGVQTGDADLPRGELHYYLAVTLTKQGDRETALIHFGKALPYLRRAADAATTAIEAAQLLTHSAKANNALAKPKEEMADYLRVIEVLPRYPSVHYLAAQAALRAGGRSKAAQLFEQSIKQGEKVVESHFEIGRLFFERGKLTKAVQHFQRALKETSDPYYLAACNYYLGYAFYKQEMYPLASAAWKEYLKHEKNPSMREEIARKLTEDPKLK